MLTGKQNILRQLQEEILPLQGFRPPTAGATLDTSQGRMGGLRTLTKAFPRGQFPTGAVHEFLSSAREDGAATAGFVGALMAPLMREGGVCIWVSTGRTVFPAALKRFGVEPHRIVFVDLRREKDALYAMEEALKTEGLGVVVGEIRDLDFTASRKLQLAVEKSRVTGLLLRHQPRQMGTVAAVARWRISATASEPEAGMPGVGAPRWKVDLLRVRNVTPGSWLVEWNDIDGLKTVNHEQTLRSAIFPAAENRLAGHPQASLAG